MRDSFDQIEERSNRTNVKHAMYYDFILIGFFGSFGYSICKCG